MSHSAIKRTPNSEQELSIFHKGGKLLSAGAGSGKTFVLIEHLVYLLSEVKKNSPEADWNKNISSECSRIVLMTFTKKAAGEMSVRMMKKIDELLIAYKNDDDKPNFAFWSLVQLQLSSLNITTIHGFCHRLLSLGYWNQFPNEVKLVSEVEHKDKITKLFNLWFLQNQENMDSVFLASSHSLLTAMIEIFSSPELRVMWADLEISSCATVEIDRFFVQLIDLRGYGHIFHDNNELQSSEKEKTKKWYELLIQFSEIRKIYGQPSCVNFLEYSKFFETISRFPVTNSKEITAEQKNILNGIRDFRADLNDLVFDLQDVINHFNIYQKWVETIGQLFKFINSNYLSIEGFSFPDLEFYVLESLKEPEVLEKIQESYSYFIVDEFQDTSFIQFEILRKLIGINTTKIFCVGDKKQAIYGFRGGELQVFSDCAQFLGKENSFYLKNNFRSFSEIIKFNNELFEQVFPLGIKFEGKDLHSVEMETQVIPNQTALSGEIVALRTEVVDVESEIDLDQIEAQILSNHILQLLKNEDLQSICVLYRKLRPSSFLIKHLLINEVAFSAQIKIQFLDDPLINLFLYLIELNLNKSNELKYKSSLLLLKTLLDVLQVNLFDEKLINQFNSDLKLIGLRLAFHKFVFSIGFTNSLYSQNAELIDSICRITNEDILKVYHLLKNGNEEDYSCEMMSGGTSFKQKKRIIIMSAHASKGLEFDAVCLGGVHTNGRYGGMKSHIGKLPHSFKWKKTFDQKKYFKSPFYHLESAILTLKDFSESKRLLYVACTRAIKHLAYVDLWSVVKDVPKDLYSNENSWIQALRLKEVSKVECKISNINTKSSDVSLIQRDSLGLLAKDGEYALGLTSELSVTRLASLADCPFKFYLQNICKIEIENSTNHLSRDLSEEDSMEDEVFYSSMARGTEVHRVLSKLFLNQLKMEDVPEKEKSKISWTYQKAIDFKENFTVISEKLIKFSFFGQMISGTPDLVFVNEDDKIIIWDFKTGLRNIKHEDSYWFQLMSYAFAYGEMYKSKNDIKLELSLLYLDQFEIVTKTYNLEEITQVLFSYWKKTDSLDQVNTEHCSNCEYSKICRKGQKSSVFDSSCEPHSLC